MNTQPDIAELYHLDDIDLILIRNTENPPSSLAIGALVILGIASFFFYMEAFNKLHIEFLRYIRNIL